MKQLLIDNSFGTNKDLDTFLKYQKQFTKQPLTKKDILFISNNPEQPEAQKLAHRTLEVQTAYKTKLATITKDNELETCKKGYIKCIYIEIKNKEFFLKPNEFPYNLAKNLKHYCIWNFQGYKITKAVIDEAIEYLAKSGKITFATWWEWPDNKKSVKKYKHIHLIIEQY